MATKQPLRRNASAINAGSMADIAFLLLIFFLVSTTMDTDAGILRLLPPMADAPVPMEHHRRNVYDVLVNDADELLVRQEPMALAQLRAGAREFMQNPGNRPDLPQRKPVTLAMARRDLAAAETRLGAAGDLNDRLLLEKSLEQARDRFAAVELLGEFMELPADALITLQTGTGTSYHSYVQVQNELEGAVRELRDELSIVRFGKKFSALNEHDLRDRERIKAIRAVYPQRISEALPVEAGYTP